MTARIPEIHQIHQTDCGAACLAMVLALHGRPVPLGVVQDAIGADRNGADAASLLEAAERFGLRGRGVSLDLDALDTLPQGAVLHWGFQHFVVFDRVTASGVDLVDPGCGRRRVTLARFGRSFTGVALTFEPAASFRAVAPEPSRYLAHLRRSVPLGPLARVVVLSVLLRGAALALPVLTGFVVDRVVPRGDRWALVVVAGGVAVLAGFQLLASLVRGQVLTRLKSRLDLATTTGFVEHLMALPYGFFQRRSTGDLLLRVASHTAIREALTGAALTAVLDGPLAALAFAGLVVGDPALATTVAALGAAALGIWVLGRRWTREGAAAELEARSHAQGELVRILAGAETLKAQGAERLAVARWSDRFVDELNAGIRRSWIAIGLDAARGALRTLGPQHVVDPVHVAAQPLELQRVVHQRVERVED
ncbi:MAG: cysteine peptidase family C39 domain-containing protein, partial [Myxococcota bacterium]